MRMNIIGKLTDIRKVPNPDNYNRTKITMMEVTDKDGAVFEGVLPLVFLGIARGTDVVLTADVDENNVLSDITMPGIRHVSNS